MVELNLQINGTIVGAVRELTAGASFSVDANIPEAAEIDPDDASLAEAWRADLIDQQQDEVGALLDLLKDRRFGREAIALEEEAAEQILRASADVRLRVRADWLGQVSDEDLENGRLDPARLPPRQQHGALAYLVLAALQESLIAGLDPDAADR